MISSDEITQCTTLSRLIVIASLCPLCPTSFQYYALSSTSFQSKSIMHYFIFRIVDNYFYVVHLAVAVFFEY